MNESRGLWRGKRIDNDKFVEGDLMIIGCSEQRYFIANRLNGCAWAVDLSTLGECTGKRDRSGKFIFEGDVCKDEEHNIYLIIWHTEMYQWQCKVIQTDCVLARDCSFPLWQWENCKENNYRTLEVIGNIYDNPEWKGEVL